ncbi:hypothetical protein EOT10_23035 [Streptomyces antnestii]|uniref:Uncharacterized protein n=1 Tax=Streptomyces antnestii TaxID=2494256 RepID=A0A3S3UEK6_9ACTN|nr:hypothetical protein EOT10_23035 [Streptomyces sp. San01]
MTTDYFAGDPRTHLERMLAATLDHIAEEGVAGVSHRRIAGSRHRPQCGACPPACSRPRNGPGART